MAEEKATRLKKRNGIWYIVWPGNRTGRSTRTRDRAIAEEALAAFLQARDAGALTGDTLLTGTVLTHYMEEHVYDRARPGAPVEAVETAEIAVRFLREHFAAIPVAHISPDDVTAYMAARRSGRIRGGTAERPSKPPGDWKLRRELGVLVAAVHHETRAREPGALRARLSKADVPHIPLPQEPPGRDRWLTDAERDRLIKAAEACNDGYLSRPYLFVWLALETAARRRSLETLTWFQVDLDRRLINLNPAGRRQTKKRRAVVPISADLLPVLLRAKFENMAKDEPSEYVLGHPGSAKKLFGSLAKAAGLQGVTAHTLRHTWATRAAQHGVSMYDIGGVLGDDEATVRKRYAHHSPDYLRDAVDFRKPAAPAEKKEEADG